MKNNLEPYHLPGVPEEKLLPLSEVVRNIRARFSKTYGTVEITEKEFTVIAKASDLVDKARGHLETTERIFGYAITAVKGI